MAECAEFERDHLREHTKAAPCGWRRTSRKPGLPKLGKYQVRLKRDEHLGSSRFWQSYTFLYTDGSTEDFGIIGETR
jgi:hypothetical protein